MRSVITFSLHISNSKFKTSYLEFKLRYVSKEIHIVNLNRFTFYHVYELLFICIVHYPQWVEIHFETDLPNLNIFNHHIRNFPFFNSLKNWIDFFWKQKVRKMDKKFPSHYISKMSYIWIAYERDSCTKQRRKNPLSCKVNIHKSRGGLFQEYVSWPTQNSLSIFSENCFWFFYLHSMQLF